MKLKISKKMQSLIWANSAPAVMLKIDAEISGGRTDKAEAVNIEADEADVARLRELAGERLPILDSALQAATTPEESKPHFGEHSAWRALMRQIEPPVPA